MEPVDRFLELQNQSNNSAIIINMLCKTRAIAKAKNLMTMEDAKWTWDQLEFNTWVLNLPWKIGQAKKSPH